MRTVQDVQDRIATLEAYMRTAMARYYACEAEDGEFEKIYSDTWDEMKVLYWVLGMSDTDATKMVAQTFIGMSDILKNSRKE